LGVHPFCIKLVQIAEPRQCARSRKVLEAPFHSQFCHDLVFLCKEHVLDDPEEARTPLRGDYRKISSVT
jgi:hypothetical protein